MRTSLDTAEPSASPAPELKALRRYPLRLLRKCCALLGVLAVGVMVLLCLVQINRFEARRISEFRRAHTDLQMQLARQDAHHARLVKMAEYAWQQRPAIGDIGGAELRRDFLAGHQRSVIIASAESWPQMALGLDADAWPAATLERYLQLSVALSLINRLTDVPQELDVAQAAYFFDPSGRYLSLGGGMTEKQLQAAQGIEDRAQLFDRLRAPAHLPSPVSDHDSIPSLAGVGGEGAVRWDAALHPQTREPSLVSTFHGYDGPTPIAAFVAYTPIQTVVDRLVKSSQGRMAVFDRDGNPVLATYAQPLPREAHGPHRNGHPPLLGHHTHVRHADGRFTLALPLKGTEWTLVEIYGWDDVLRYAAPTLLLGLLILGVSLLLLGWALSCLHRRVFACSLERVGEVYAQAQMLRETVDACPVGLAVHVSGEPAARLLNPAARSLVRRSDDRLLAHLAAPGGSGAIAITRRLGSVHLRMRGRMGSTKDQRHWAVEDIGEWMQRIDAERRNVAEADARSRAKSAFVATMSHEIRTPLYGIMGHLDLMTRALEGTPQYPRLRCLMASSESLMQVINDGLDMARIEAGQLSLTATRFSPIALMERVAALFAPLAQSKGIALDCQALAATPSCCNACEGAIERVLRNLVSNALKFTAAGHVRITVSHELREGSAWLRFEVADSGVGLTAEQCEHLFRPFAQVDHGMSPGMVSSGLGLALCHQMCAVMGGDISVRSTPGVGSLFMFAVPVQACPNPLPPRLEGRQVVLEAPTGLWQGELERRLRSEGAAVQCVTSPTPPEAVFTLGADVPWVVVEEEDERRPHPHPVKTLLRVRRDGPLQAQWCETGWEVSCYSTTALIEALVELCDGDAPSLATDAPMG